MFYYLPLRTRNFFDYIFDVENDITLLDSVGKYSSSLMVRSFVQDTTDAEYSQIFVVDIQVPFGKQEGYSLHLDNNSNRLYIFYEDDEKSIQHKGYVNLPQRVDFSNAKATYSDGVARVELPIFRHSKKSTYGTELKFS